MTTTSESAVLDRDAILKSFLADAEADAAAGVTVAEAARRCDALSEQLADARAAFAAAYAAASRRPNVAVKLRELGIRDPGSVKGGDRSAARKRPVSRPASSRRAPVVSAPPAGKPAGPEEDTSSNGEHTA